MPLLRPAPWLALAAAACTTPSSSTGGPLVSGTCTGTGSGSLRLTLDMGTGELVREPVAVVLDADGAEVARAEATTTLDLPGGTYIVEAWRGEGDPGDGLAGIATGVAGSPVTEVCVGDGATTEVTLAWEALPSGEHLWVSSGESLAAFSAAAVAEGGEQDADILLATSLVNDFRGFAFDRTGTLWAATGPTYGSRVMWWTPDRLTGRGDAPPSGELWSDGFAATEATSASLGDLAFGPDGTLWVQVNTYDWHGLVGFSPLTLDRAVLDGASDAPPDETREVAPLVAESDLELDPDGSLWLVDFWGEGIHRVDDPHDGGRGVDASLEVWAPGGSAPLVGPQNLAFRENGDAVAFFWTGTEVALLPASAIDGSGDLVVTAAPGSGTVTDLGNGLVVDGGDHAWLGEYGADGRGRILGWEPGADLFSQLDSADIPDPADLALDPRPR